MDNKQQAHRTGLRRSVAFFALASLAACGSKSSSNAIDAHSSDSSVPVVDAQVDAAPDGNPGAFVSIIVGGRITAEPFANATVVFLQPDDTLIATKQTDSQGEARQLMSRAGTVAVIRTAGDQVLVDVLLGVKPGDHLRVGLATVVTPVTVVDSVYLPLASAGSVYDVRTSCSFSVVAGTSTRLSVPLEQPCLTPDIYGRVTDGVTHQIRYLYKPMCERTGSENGYVVRDQVLQNFSTFNAGLTSIPLGFNETTISIAQLAGTIPVANDQLQQVPVLGAVSGALTITGIANATSTIDMSLRNSITGSVQFVRTRTAVASLNLDVAPRLLSTMTIPSFDQANSRVEWNEAVSALTAEVANVVLDFERGPVQTPTKYTWNILGPHDAPGIHVPVLPASLMQYQPAATDTLKIQAQIFHPSVSYDQLKALEDRQTGFSPAVGAFVQSSSTRNF
jgi:hypothetical protein